MLNSYTALIFKLELSVKSPMLDQSGTTKYTEKIIPLSEYTYAIPIEKRISRKDERVELDIPKEGVSMEGWMTPNPEFLSI